MNKRILSHLQHDYTEPVRDPLWKHIYLSRPLEKIIQQPVFLRLGRIKQLGPARLVYPGASHTRYSHSLGVFYLAKEVIMNLLTSHLCPDLSPEGVKAFLCAALLHDIGHYPHAHSFHDLPLEDHETLSARLIMDPPLENIIKREVGADPLKAAAIIDHKINADNDTEIHFFRNILSGVLDPDKLDYLNRDAYFCGVPYGIQDTDFVISQIKPTQEGLALTEKGVTAIENILFSKYLMYKTVYWHRTVRISTALIKKAVFLGLSAGLFNPEEIYRMDDEEFFARYADDSDPILSLIKDSEAPYRYKTIWEKDFYNQLYYTRISEYRAMADRHRAEQKIADKIREITSIDFNNEQILIDIPANISFEVDLPVISKEGTVPFMESDSVFSRPVVENFTKTLQKMRIIIPAVLAEREDIRNLFESAELFFE